MSDLPHCGPPLREVSAVGWVVTSDRNDGEKTRLTKNSARYEHVLAHDLWVSIEAALPHEHLSPSENPSNQLSRMIKHTSTHKATLFAPPNQRLGTLLCYFAACATTHIPQVQLDRVLLCECDHRADELIGLKVDVSGEFIAEFELVFGQLP